MSHLSKDKVGKGAAFLYVEIIAGMVSGYIFWLVISRFTTPQIIGISATIVASATIITIAANMGIPVSIQRFLGRALGTQQTENIRVYTRSSVLLFVLSLAVCGIAFITAAIAAPDILSGISRDYTLIILAFIFIASSSFTRLFRGIIIASVNTKILALATLMSTAVKFTVASLLLFIGLGATGLTAGIVSFTVLQSIIMGMNVKHMLGSARPGAPSISIRSSMHNLLVGGMPDLVPTLITAIGSQLGTILVFGVSGAAQAGIYFIAFSIYTGITAGIGVLFSIMYPVLSSIEEGRKRLSYRTIKLSLLSTVPFAYSIFIYTDNVMSIFGESYSDGSPALQMLLLSVMPIAVMTGVINYVYASGNYRYSLLVGATSSATRAALYFIFVPLLGSLGAALSFTVGSFVGLTVTIFIVRKVELTVNWRDILVISIVPLGIASLLNILEIEPLLSIIISMALSYGIFIKIRIMTRDDIHDALRILPKRIANPIAKIIDSVGSRLERSY